MCSNCPGNLKRVVAMSRWRALFARENTSLSSLAILKRRGPAPERTMLATCRRTWRQGPRRFPRCLRRADQEGAEASYLAMRLAIEELWRFAKYRDMAFRDLLAILDAATKHTDLGAFGPTQRNVLRSVFQDLPTWLIEYEVVESAIQKFAEHNIDISGPIRSTTPRRFRVTIEEID